MVLTCQHCTRAFPSKRRKRKYCSHQCAWAHGHSAATRMRMSLARKGMEMPPRSEEHQRNLSTALKGRRLSESAREKIGAAHRGRKRSPEWCAAISEGLRGDGNPCWNPNREEVVTRAKFAKIQRNLLNRVLRQLGRKKRLRTYEECGYTIVSLKSHLEARFLPGMSWENHGMGPGTWQVDHIRPVRSFPLDAPMQEVNALSNLQPLWSSENIRKYDRWEKQ